MTETNPSRGFGSACVSTYGQTLDNSSTSPLSGHNGVRITLLERGRVKKA